MLRAGATRAVARCTLALGAVHAAACGGAAAPPPRAAPDAPVAAVPVDPRLVLPRPGASASGTSGLVVLVAPPDPAPVRATVAAFFDAVIAESAPDLEKLVDPAARSRTSTKARPDPALSFWRRRFDALDYTPLASEVFFFPSAMEVHTARDVSTGAGVRGLPVVPRSEEVLVRVPIVGQSAAKLMGDEIVFLLKPEPSRKSGYTIAELYEDFRLP
jgi:hypothetical protein